MKLRFKSCSGCQEVKPMEAFSVASARQDGRTSVCKVCLASIRKRSRQAKRDRDRASVPDLVESKRPRAWYVYILACESPGHVYVGLNLHPLRRIEEHKAGRGASFTKLHGVSHVLKILQFPTKHQAFRAEADITAALWFMGFETGYLGSGYSVPEVRQALAASGLLRP